MFQPPKCHVPSSYPCIKHPLTDYNHPIESNLKLALPDYQSTAVSSNRFLTMSDGAAISLLMLAS